MALILWIRFSTRSHTSDVFDSKIVSDLDAVKAELLCNAGSSLGAAVAKSGQAMHELAFWIAGDLHDIGPDGESRQQPDALGQAGVLLSQPQSRVHEVGANTPGADMFQNR